MRRLRRLYEKEKMPGIGRYPMGPTKNITHISNMDPRDASAFRNSFPQIRNGKGMTKNIPKLREHEVNEKKTIPNFVNGNRMKKSIPIIWERESEAFILGNELERGFPLTPANWSPANWAPRRFGGKLGPMPIGNTQTLGPGGCFLGLGGIGRP